MIRAVVDTNIVVGASYRDESASRKVVEACIAGLVVPVASPPLRREYERVFAKAIRRPSFANTLSDFYACLRDAEADAQKRPLPDAPEDEMLLRLAAGADATLITNDRLVLAGADLHRDLRIVSPGQFLAQLPNA